MYRVKAMLTVNRCLEAFWLGNLKNRDIHVSIRNLSVTNHCQICTIVSRSGRGGIRRETHMVAQGTDQLSNTLLENDL